MMMRKRTEPRLKLSLPIVSEWQTEDGLLIRAYALSDNISYQGVGLILQSALNSTARKVTPGSRIKLTANHSRFSANGTVCHVNKQYDGRWLIGIKLDEPLFGWLARYQQCRPQLLHQLVS